MSRRIGRVEEPKWQANPPKNGAGRAKKEVADTVSAMQKVTVNRILVVDDDLAHRTMLRKLLASWGYTVVDVDDGETAIAAVREKPFDLILMDIRMIRVSGLQALATIKAYNPAIPILIMTAYASVETAVEALKSGAYDYLTKPLDFTKLRPTLERAMDHSRLKEENKMLRETLGNRFDRVNLIGRSLTMTKLLELAPKGKRGSSARRKGERSCWMRSARCR